MLTSLQGTFRKGQIKLSRTPLNIPDDTPVIVTFLENGGVDLHTRGISKEQARTLRAQLATFIEDWESPEMSDYDNYDAVKSHAQTR